MEIFDQGVTKRWYVPFSLKNCQVTVEDIGWNPRNNNRDDVSQKIFVYKEEPSQDLKAVFYPVKYRASRSYQSICWVMTVEINAAGKLIFAVRNDHGEKFEGSTPTAPWALMALRKRDPVVLNGPEAFGFKDLANLSLLQRVRPNEPTFDIWSDLKGPSDDQGGDNKTLSCAPSSITNLASYNGVSLQSEDNRANITPLALTGCQNNSGPTLCTNTMFLPSEQIQLSLLARLQQRQSGQDSSSLHELVADHVAQYYRQFTDQN